MKKTIYVLVGASLILGGVFLGWLLRGGQNDVPAPPDNTESSTPIVPVESTEPTEPNVHETVLVKPENTLEESIVPPSPNISDENVQAVPEVASVQPAAVPPIDVPPITVTPTEEMSPAPAQPPAPASVPPTPSPVSYLYFYTGVPVHPMPSSVVYTSGFMPAVSIPVVQPYIVPVFVPQIPKRIEMSRIVYWNCVVIQPQVYWVYPRGWEVF